MVVDRARFEAVVAEAVAGLPQKFREGLHNIAIVIDDRPPKARARSLLLGCYEGTPLPQRTHEFAGAPPDRITLFQANIEALCRDEAEMIEEIRKTLLHEIGHYFGLTERKLRKLGY